jgi:hypothetical protein
MTRPEHEIMIEAQEPPTFLTEDEVVSRYRGAVTAGTLRNWRAKGQGPSYVKIGKAALYPLAALLAWEADREVICRARPS